MLYMVIETYLQGPDPVYDRFQNKGRMLPPGLDYIDSWVDAGDRRRCFQLMSTEDASLIDVWIEHWQDIVDFEVVQVMSSTDASSHRPAAS